MKKGKKPKCLPVPLLPCPANGGGNGGAPGIGSGGPDDGNPPPQCPLPTKGNNMQPVSSLVNLLKRWYSLDHQDLAVKTPKGIIQVHRWLANNEWTWLHDRYNLHFQYDGLGNIESITRLYGKYDSNGTVEGLPRFSYGTEHITGNASGV